VLVALGYFQAATVLERRAIAAQDPIPAAETAAPRYANRDQVMRDLGTLASREFAGRRTGTEGGRKARAWVVEQFKAARLVPAGSRSYLQPFRFTQESVRGLVLPNRPFRTEYRDAANVMGRIDGSNPDALPIVVSAHYDHLGAQDGEVYAGADDNASGVAVLLAAARHFAVHRPHHSLIFAAFDAEELGLRGSRAFVASRPRGRVAALNVNLDMVSRSDRNEIFAAGTYHYPQLKPPLEDLQKRVSVKILFGHDRPMRTAGGVDDWTSLSDHAAFHAAGVPFVYFGVEDHPDYHQPTDTADKIQPRFVGGVADMVVEAIKTLDGKLP
jgi:hypothetical protein